MFTMQDTRTGRAIGRPCPPCVAGNGARPSGPDGKGCVRARHSHPEWLGHRVGPVPPAIMRAYDTWRAVWANLAHCWQWIGIGDWGIGRWGSYCWPFEPARFVGMPLTRLQSPVPGRDLQESPPMHHRKTTVLLPCTSTRSSRWQRRPRASTVFSMSLP